MRPQYSLVTAPTTEPITLDQASEHLRVDSSDDISYIAALISVAREYVESVTGKVSGTSTWKLSGPDWQSMFGNFSNETTWRQRDAGEQINTIPLFRTPLASVTSINYYAPDATTLTEIDSDDYIAILGFEPGMVKMIGDLPSVSDRPDAIQIEFVAGYTSPGLAPAVLRHAVKMLVGHLYENRLPVAFASCAEIPYTLKNLIENQKVGGWIA